MDTSKRPMHSIPSSEGRNQASWTGIDLYTTVSLERINPWEKEALSIEDLIQAHPQEETIPQTLRASSRPVHSQNSQEEVASSPNKASKHQEGKNRNLLKFVIKLLRDHARIVRSTFQPSDSASFSQLHTYLHELFEWQKESPSNHNISQTHLKWIMEEKDEESRIRSQAARRALSKILRRQLGKVTLRNNRCRSKLIYMNGLKVYQLRCRNSRTALRLQC